MVQVIKTRGIINHNMRTDGILKQTVIEIAYRNPRLFINQILKRAGKTVRHPHIQLVTEHVGLRSFVFVCRSNKLCYNNRFATLAYWIFTLVGTGGPALWHRPFPDR